eukprot:TRINITY_DN71515_c0_g1_i1.p1 TRINITY_DN71515_c0_g1~~TRINITY_DN71515_c0_g1_i1.p1  ORF type:complete len:162 (-),score=66.80 TRINITY_DN71515_c0_g1_i1:82-567(-)
MGTRLEEEGNTTQGEKIKSLYFDILNSKGTKSSYEEIGNEKDESKHSRKLNKKRAKALRKQQKKLMEGDKDSDDEIPFYMQDASIKAAMVERALEEKEKAKQAKKDAKKGKKRKASSSSDDSSSSSEKKKKGKKKKDKKKKTKKKSKKKKDSSSSSSGSSS